ncbi:hypothetical protein SAMN05192574_102218 [Mucilaginibacter gossypiicola]|uniref:Uncharacterized protein n=1 Tax=Mucilaginibacter gossypiicola TaxID=551995 RepID=A0A1H8D6Y0_9SPHI|nr:hypothetical protein [Mucilaginibacter gossypiicola]SEN02564.1 hypothetical protein SAMN05192574_102218 [Mucilaginibacter gossypiicola]
MGFFSFISKLLGIGRHWNGSPEQYLAMVQYMAKKNNPNFTLQEFLQWGEVMQKVMKVNLKPYKDFRELLEKGDPDYSMVEKLDGKLSELNKRRELKQAIYGPNARLGDDDVMNSNSKSAIEARNMVKDLSQHVRFSDDDQKIIDDM